MGLPVPTTHGKTRPDLLPAGRVGSGRVNTGQVGYNFLRFMPPSLV